MIFSTNTAFSLMVRWVIQWWHFQCESITKEDYANEKLLVKLNNVWLSIEEIIACKWHTTICNKSLRNRGLNIYYAWHQLKGFAWEINWAIYSNILRVPFIINDCMYIKNNHISQKLENLLIKRMIIIIRDT